MRYLKDQGFVIRRINFGDSHRFITLFTKNNGKVEVVAKGVRKITSKRASSVELLNLIEFQSVHTSKNFILTEVKLLDSFENLKQDLKNMEKVFFTCELLDAIMPFGQKHPDVFALIKNTIPRLPETPESMIFFQIRLLTMLGFWDKKNRFRNEEHIHQYIEQILERRLKTRNIFKSLTR
ncbi:MAG: DNA repair protein RecO [Candidatus Levybacteria bacterium RIFCSPHIGHO2_02_FULL_39_36]|nr:MAG: repair protein RecO protein [Candidatus Levybacteria bacterium GW2011_GWA1_39_11]KKR24862.1 MAG: repair protein RecO protein [Candidatus Levybacteria bacterium GW2011_GWB1_39_7]KKR27078.1 MAG: repair protein RecO, DNA repair protein RecO (recombination protein O) protein [Microgenomates group bacterium GW2011_GWC1_39_7]KKR50103.1 MAG: repair protein RecO protein [Candidatus Levybacteria bacterium GW2011_GWA2_40_16]OGH15555.1 MAG: DNA repair protein RecO [Candidatus Levybacteria bacteriu